jgi:surfeit locus 1 family protein
MLCLVGIVSMVLLSRWQFDRMFERRDFNDEVRDRTSLPLVDLAAIDLSELDPTELDPAELEWRTAGAKGTYLGDEQVTIVNRSQNGRAGANVVVPLRLADGRLVLVNRGFIGLDDPVPPPPSGEVRVVGILRAGETRRTGQPADVEGDLDELLRLDIERIDEQVDGVLLPIVLTLEESDPTEDAALSPVPLPELDGGPHLSYAIQWLIFATAVAVGWVMAIRWSWRRQIARSMPSS